MNAQLKTLTAKEREKINRRLAAEYKKGKSIRALAEENGYSYGFTHTAVRLGGATLRRRGGSPKRA
jgi:hypothetical protein